MRAINDLMKTTQAIVITILLSFSNSTLAEHHEFEVAAELRAADVLSADLLKGEHHSVERTVKSDGYLNYYTIKSDYGEFEAISTAMLGTRIGEIDALAELDDLSQTEVFIKAAADAGVGQLKTLKTFATHPVDTVVGIPSGIGRMFKRYTRQAGEAVDATKEFVAGDDEEAAEGEEGDEETTTDKSKGLTESFFGVSGADIIGEVNDAVWSKDPYELQDMNRARLIATGADEALIEEYLENLLMSPSQQTLLTAAISEIAENSGRDGILRQALNAETEAEADFLIKSVTMLVWYHLNQKPVSTVSTYAAVPVGITEDGTSTLVFAADHVYWTETIAKAAGRHASQAKDSNTNAGEVWLLGSASDRTRDELKKLGFDVHEGVAALMTTPDS